MIRRLWVGRFLGGGPINVEGAIGDIFLFWKKRILELVPVEVGVFQLLSVS